MNVKKAVVFYRYEVWSHT